MLCRIGVLGALCLPLGACFAPAFLPTLTAIGAVAGTIGTTEQLGITAIGDALALKKPKACSVAPAQGPVEAPIVPEGKPMS
jgi:hypothetical protein